MGSSKAATVDRWRDAGMLAEACGGLKCQFTYGTMEQLLARDCLMSSSFALFIKNLRFSTRTLRGRLNSIYEIIHGRPTARPLYAAAAPVRE
jgi:hypothetical protein